MVGVDLVAVYVRDASGARVIGRAQVVYAQENPLTFGSYDNARVLDGATQRTCASEAIYAMGCGGVVVMQLLDADGAPLALEAGMTLTIERLDKRACGVTLEPREERLAVSVCTSAPATDQGVGACVALALDDDLADRVEVRIP